MLTKLFIHIHRILGLILCILCFSWFISGIVMIYHSFPRVSQEDRFTRAEILDTNGLPAIQDVLFRLPAKTPIHGLSLNNPYGDPVFSIGGGRQSVELYADTNVVAPVINYALCENRAARWCADRKITRVDTLRTLDQWIPLAHYKREFPIYKFYFDGPEKYQLYVSSRTANILQFTDSDNRFWAWFGAIPHWVYFTVIRGNQNLWTQFMYWACYLGMFMCFTGFVLGIRSYWLARRKGFLRSPYKKQWFKWHHITGFFFGIFVFTWILSGYMSMAPLPSWLFGKQDSRGFRQSPAERQAPSPADYALDYRKAIALTATSDDPVKTIEWTHYQGIPLYRLRTVSKEVTLDASTDTIRPFRITEEMILAAVKRLAGDSTTYSITKMNEYDNYYISRRRPLPLPVYKVTFDNKAKDCYYYNLESFRPVHYDTNERWKRWLYRGLHTLDIKFLVERPALWTVVIWTLLLGGAVVSFTGIVLSVKYLKNRFIKFVKFIRFIK